MTHPYNSADHVYSACTSGPQPAIRRNGQGVSGIGAAGEPVALLCT
jgi:hypothetical protein